MPDERDLKKVIARLMVQVEEEKRRRIEMIQAFASLPSQPVLVKTPTDEEIERRILELL